MGCKINESTGNLDCLFVPTPGNLPIFKKDANALRLARGMGGWVLLELTDAVGVITILYEIYFSYFCVQLTLFTINKMYRQFKSC